MQANFLDQLRRAISHERLFACSQHVSSKDDAECCLRITPGTWCYPKAFIRRFSAWKYASETVFTMLLPRISKLIDGLTCPAYCPRRK